jgi:hypothetical protein
MFSNYRSYYNKEPEQRCMTDQRIKNNPLSSFENKQRSFSNISYMVFFTYFTNRRFHSFEAATYRRVPALIEIPVSRNPFKALSIHVNHNECVFLRTSSCRVSCYQIVLSGILYIFYNIWGHYNRFLSSCPLINGF